MVLRRFSPLPLNWWAGNIATKVDDSKDRAGSIFPSSFSVTSEYWIYSICCSSWKDLTPEDWQFQSLSMMQMKELYELHWIPNAVKQLYHPGGDYVKAIFSSTEMISHLVCRWSACVLFRVLLCVNVFYHYLINTGLSCVDLELFFPSCNSICIKHRHGTIVLV